MQNKIYTNLKDFKYLLKGFLPKDKTELLLFVGFLVFYLSYSLFIAFNTSLVEGDGIFFFDLYFSFDNPLLFKQGFFSTHDVAHPFMRYISKPYMWIGELLILYWGIKAKVLLTVSFCSSAISLSIVYIYRYLKNIIGNNRLISILISVFYGFFTTNIILCFTPESYTLTVLLLTYCVLYNSEIIQQNKKPSFFSSLFFSFGLGGITLTNFVKGLIPTLFIKEEIRITIKRVIIISILFIGFIALLEMSTNSFSFRQTVTEKLTFVVDENAEYSLFFRIVDLFFIAPVFFLDVIKEPVQLLVGEKPDHFFVINMGFAHYWWQYTFAVIMYGLVIWSIIANRKNKLVWLILLMYLVDIAIHVIIGYGLKDPFIFGGHWVYVVPLLLGWLYNAISDNLKKILLYILVIIVLVCVVNNLSHLSDFVTLSIDLFPVKK